MKLPSVKSWNSWDRYLLALATIALAAALQSGLQRLVEDRVPFMLFDSALVLIAVYCGRGPALLALFLSALHAALTLQAFSSDETATSARYSVVVYVGVGLLIVFVTSTLRRSALRAQDAELRLRMVQEDAGVGLWEADLRSGTVLASPSMWRLFGLTGSTGPVSARQWQSHLQPEEVQASLTDMQAQIAAGAKSYDYEFRAVVAGEMRFFYARINVDYDENGRGVRLRAAVVDVTSRKQLEAEQQRRIEELREADRRRTEFLATLAHELRNPLAPIRHATNIAKLPQATGDQVQWALAVIDRQIGHMARLLEDLLEASRISRGVLELRRESVQLASVIAAAVETAKPLIETKQHVLDCRVPTTPIWLDADPVRLAQVFSNLLTNAAKYTDSPGHIGIEVELVEDQVEVRVHDTGIGIASEVLPELFEMFAQAHSALEHAQGGLGIGLSLVRGLVQLHGGTVNARSSGPGEGSQFAVRLPRIAAPAQNALSAPSENGATRSAARRVLVADDNRDAADSLAVLLELEGHEIVLAYNGIEAFDVCELEPPQVALLDIGMPGLNGYDLARRIRAQAWGQHVKLIAITGWGQADDRNRALQAGFDFHLTKPVTPQALAAVLSSVNAQGIAHDDERATA
jgi:PAS domain S-box-containing protein